MGRAIVREPAAFLMDEPLSNLDAKLRVQMRAEIKKLQDDLGTTTIYVTHDQVEAMTMGDRVAVMRKGELQQVAAPQELYDRPVNLFVGGFIGSPAMNLVEAKLERVDGGLAAVAGSQKIALGDETLSARPGLKSYEGRDVILGIRPEDLEDAELEPDRPGDQTVSGEVELTEALGSEIMAHFSIDAPPRDHGRGAGAAEGRRHRESRRARAGGGRPHGHGRPLRRPLDGRRRARPSRSPSTRAHCTSSTRRRVSASTTEPKERELEDDEATLHPARAARGACSRCSPPAAAATTTRRRDDRRRDDRGGGRRGVSGNISVLAVWTGAEGEAFQAVLDGFKEQNPDVTVSYKSAQRAGDGALDRCRGRQPAGHRGIAAARSS